MTDETPTHSHTITKTISTYQAVHLTCVAGFTRLYKASNVIDQLALALALGRDFRARNDAGGTWVKELNASLDNLEARAQSDTELASDLLSNLLKNLPYDAFDAMRYVTNVAFLVYSTALLDTFLTETTIFLFLLLPESMGKTEQIPLKTLIAAHSREDALQRVAAARARQIASRSFEERLQILSKTFGLEIEFDSDTLESLRSYSEMRNRAVHDQGYFELKLDETGDVCHRQRSCAQHPIRITEKDSLEAARVYERVCHRVARSIFIQVLKHEEPAVIELIDSL